jgi:trk system potassium uptake protein TrkH
MNKRMIVYIIAKMLGVEGAVLLLPALVSWIYGEKMELYF